jgi:hypothetical protein
LSEYITNAATFLIITNWIFELNFKEKYQKIVDNKGIVIFLILFLVHVLWMINSENTGFGWNDLRIKLPLLALPVIIGTSQRLKKTQLDFITQIFIAGVLISSLSGLLIYFGALDNPDPGNVRNLSVFISHIRLSLMVCLSILLIFYFIHERKFFVRYRIVFAVILIVWFLAFLILIQGFTGLTTLVIVGIITISVKAFNEKKLSQRILYYVFVFGIPLSITFYLGYHIKTFYSPTVDKTEIHTQTQYGNSYYSNKESRLLENGNLIYKDICEKELYSEWNKRSSMKLDANDSREQSLLHTLIRFLTSKGYTKDAYGISQLNDNEIRQIENGTTNYRFVHQSLNKRIYNIIWQIDVYVKGGNPSGHSITQRFEYLKAGSILAYRNFLFGTGTGDVDDAFKALYIEKRSQLDSKYRHRAHNQYLTFFVAFGVFGGVICLFAFFYPVIFESRFGNFQFMVFVLIAVLSMFTDDTIETTTGVVFISYFYSLFLWGEK